MKPNSALIIAIGIALILDIFTGFFVISAPPPIVIHDQTPLGQWSSFPLVSSCSLSPGNVNVTARSCELLGNNTQRGSIIEKQGVAMTQITALLSVGCAVLSSTIGADLEMAYAIFDGNTNITNFQLIGGQLFIDGVNSPGCTTAYSFGVSGTQLLNTTAANQGYIFKVVGGDGGGLGDNPRFFSVNVILEQNRPRLFTGTVTSHTATNFAVQIAATVSPSSNTLVNFMWIATNATLTNPASTVIGSGSCTINSGGLACSTTISYGFTWKTVPNVSVTPTLAAVGFVVPVSTISLLLSQTVTV